ncbi:MAG: methylamine utilization protein [Burkholderiales bacterium]|nr:methylamine utilization protein [Burkholderiales bacterium]
MTKNLPTYTRTCRNFGTAVFVIAATQTFAAQISAQIRDPAGQPVADAVIYAVMTSGVVPARPKREISVEQIDKEFVPLVSVIQSGTMVSFPNRDKVRHHVYSFSPAKTFEIKLYSGVPGKPIMFDKPGEVVLGCNIHDSMIAYMLVVDTPFFAKSDKRGTALLENLPTGDYELHMWYPGAAASATPLSQKTKLSASDAVTLTFAFTLKPQSPSVPRPSAGK